MKRNFLIPSVFLSLCLLAFSQSQGLRTNLTCQWFLYHNPSISDPQYDFPVNLAEATTVLNYVPASYFDLETLCNQAKVICAICAETDNFGRPLLGPNQYLVIYHLDPYFRIPNEYLRVPNTSFIKEKFWP